VILLEGVRGVGGLVMIDADHAEKNRTQHTSERLWESEPVTAKYREVSYRVCSGSTTATKDTSSLLKRSQTRTARCKRCGRGLAKEGLNHAGAPVGDRSAYMRWARWSTYPLTGHSSGHCVARRCTPPGASCLLMSSGAERERENGKNVSGATKRGSTSVSPYPYRGPELGGIQTP
jgi:hypothetical protein